MPTLTPVDYDPFAQNTQPTLTPVDYDPFAQNPSIDLQAAFKAKKLQSNALTKNTTSIPNRFMHGMEDAAFGVAQLVPRGAGAVANGIGDLVANVSPQAGMAIQDSAGNFYNQSAQDMDAITQQRAQSYEQARQAEGQNGFDAARLAGNVFSPVNGVGAAVSNALPQAGSFLGKVARDAALGGVGASIQPAEDPNKSFTDQKLDQIKTGALLTGIFSSAGNSVSKVVKPQIQDGAQTLLDEGIRLTPGQLKGGVIQSVEDKLTSIPLLGDAIKNAKVRSYEDFNRAVANRALSPIDQKLPDNIPVGRDMVDYVGTTLGNRYDEILPKMKAFYDNNLSSDIARISSKAKLLPKDQQQALKSLVRQNFENRSSNEITGNEFKEITSQLGSESSGLKADPNHYNRKLGSIVSELKDAVLNSAKRHSDPTLVEQLSKTDKGYANFVRLQKAAGSLGAKDGVISPAQLQNAVKTSEKSVRSGKFAKGQNLMQDLSDPALNILPSTVPDSGTAGRAALGLLATGGAGFVNPVAAAGALGATSLYTKPGVAVLQKVLADRPDLAEPVARAIKQGTSLSDILAMFSKGGSGNATLLKVN